MAGAVHNNPQRHPQHLVVLAAILWMASSSINSFSWFAGAATLQISHPSVALYHNMLGAWTRLGYSI